jgi:hypothetical protein
MSTQSTSAASFHPTSRPSSAGLPVAILLALCVLSFATVLLGDDAPAWAEVEQYAG